MADWNRQYVDALLRYCSSGEEADLTTAYELGRKLLYEGNGLTTVAYAHWDGFQDLLTRRVSASHDTLKKSRDFLVESLAPLEMGLRGFREANTTLRQLNTDLEALVSKRTEALEHANAELEALLSAVPVGLLLLTPNRELRWLNETRAHELAIEDRSAVVGTRARQIEAGIDLEAVERALAGELVDVGEVPSSGGRVLEVKYRPVWSQGIIIGVLEVTQDVTDRKSAAAERDEIRKRLEAAQRMEAIGRLAGGIAHDFNNLLTVIGTYSHMLEENVSGDDALEDLKLIQDASDRAARLTQQLLAFSRRQPQELRLVDLGMVVRDLERMFERLLGEDIELTVRVPDETLPVLADVSQIEQVVMNLVVNARDAMPAGGTLEVEVTRRKLDTNLQSPFGEDAPPGDYVMLRTTDDGEGMDADTLTHIFEPFFTTKSAAKGTGLGLSTVYGIVRQNKGYVFVSSEPGQGATFTIYLPQATGDLDEPREEDPPNLQGTETVLHVEDDEMVRQATQRILTRNGYRVVTAASGREALAIVRSGEPPVDVVLTDMVMPGMNGNELIRRLRSLRSDLAIVAASGYTDSALSRRGMGAVELFISKPFAETRLLTILRKAIEASQQED